MKLKKKTLGKQNPSQYGFERMGFAWPIYKAIMTKGYKIPTPIQRKVIPLILNGKDILAMSRTGSGKTAAFLLPLLQKLYSQKMEYKQKFSKKVENAKQSSVISSIKALIISPTRELALQTYKFFKEFARFCDISAALILGGESMDSQFALFHNNKDPPNVIIATPGRLLHLLVEMNLQLKSVNTLVLDEADRLLEMGFSEQLTELVGRVPGVEDRQTLLFSATVPSMLAEFSRSQGIINNDDSSFRFVRLDTEFKLSQSLKLNFLSTHSQDKLNALLYLLQSGLPRTIEIEEVIDDSDSAFPKNTTRQTEPNMVIGKTLVFLPTKHHVEYVKEILESLGISCTYAYSSLDPVARKGNVAKFATGRTKIMLVTDIAARGIDIPLLDNVIMYAFPATPKLFLHRVGRVARAGKSGNAYSILAPNEVPYLLDLMNFLGHDLVYYRVGVTAPEDSTEDGTPQVRDYDSADRRPRHLLATFPPDFLENEQWRLAATQEEENPLSQVCERALGKYLASLPAPSKISIAKAKKDFLAQGGPCSLKSHPMFCDDNAKRQESSRLVEDNLEYLSRLRTYKPDGAIFEDRKKFTRANPNGDGDKGVVKLGAQPKNDSDVLPKDHLDARGEKQGFKRKLARAKQPGNRPIPNSKTAMVKGTTSGDLPAFADPRYFVQYRPLNFESEKGLELPQDIVMDMAGDEGDGKTAPKGLGGKKRYGEQMVWDPKRKKFINPSGSSQTKTIRTESGVRIPASYKRDIYKTWLKKSHGGALPVASTTNWRNKGGRNGPRAAPDRGVEKPSDFNENRVGSKGGKIKNFTKALGLKRPEQVFKERSRKERVNAYASYRRKVNSSKKQKKKKTRRR